MPPLTVTVTWSDWVVVICECAGVTVTVGVPTLTTVTFAGLEVDDGQVPLPPNIAVSEFAPDCSDDADTETEQLPSLEEVMVH